MEVKTILWPTDLSKNSLKATKHVSSLAQKYSAKVVMLYVGTDLNAMLPHYGVMEEEHIKRFHDYELKHAKGQMETVCGPHLEGCPIVDIQVVTGDPAAEILKKADEVKADMIVLTTHGRGYGALDQRTPAFGSVAGKVIRGARVPVHIVNPFMEA